MSDAENKTSTSPDAEDPIFPSGWMMLVMTPEFWFIGVMAILIAVVVGNPESRTAAIFLAVVLFVFLVGLIALARGLIKVRKVGKSASGGPDVPSDS